MQNEKNPMKILFVQTGGSIDKTYPKVKGYKFEIDEPAARTILDRARPEIDYEIVSLMKKESSDMTDDDRQEIYDFCEKSDYEKIIITHGTDTMVDTAHKLGPIKDKTIILTGASLPEKFYESDASFNLGTAVGAISVVQKGVYIAMNGRVYAWDHVKENMSEGRFIDS
jgi:L-asparaginase